METEVTQALWVQVMGVSTPPGEAILTTNGETYESISLHAPTYPVHGVGWCEAVTFANTLSEREGLQPAYSGTTTCTESRSQSVTWDTTADGYRLLTEAEWERAARAGTSHTWSGTSDLSSLHRYANTADQVHAETFKLNTDRTRVPSDGALALSPVAAYRPNAWGLHDMTGNVWEWVWDPYQATSPDDRPTPTDRVDRFFRGGSWGISAFDVRIAKRISNQVSVEWDNLGFRLARSGG